MANTYLKPEQHVQLVLAELYKAERLSGLVTPFDGNNFVGAKNDQLIYKFPGVTIARDYTWRTRVAPIIYDQIARGSLAIKIDQHMYTANRWTDEERKFDMVSWQREIAAPMATAIQERFDMKILAAIQAADWAVTDLNIVRPNAANEKDNSVLVEALKLKAKLDAAGTPQQGRRLVLGANAFQWFASSPSVLKYDPAQALTVFRRGVFGTVAGFDIVDGTLIIGADDVLALHPSWAVLANAAPELPESLNYKVRANWGGYSMRLIADYDKDFLSDALIANTFWGISEIKDQLQRHTTASAATANDGSSKGDPVVVDGEVQFTGKNVRGGKGTYSVAA